MSKNRFWTEEELQKLTQMIGKGQSYAQISATLGRSIDAVKIRAWSEGLRQNYVGSEPATQNGAPLVISRSAKLRKWTQTEDDILRNSTESLAVLARKLDRSTSAIYQRRYHIRTGFQNYGAMRTLCNDQKLLANASKNISKELEEIDNETTDSS